MRHINRHVLLGNVGNIVQLQNSLKVSIATNRDWMVDGERKTVTDWSQVTILDKKQVEWVGANVAQGDLVYIESRVINSSYERDGSMVYSTDLIVNIFNLLAKKTQNAS